MGTATILDARRILLLASGADKAEMLASALEGPLTEMLPASALQLHADLTVMAEASSATHLIRK
jgi:glucosamine-6-phosphate deaminase